MMFRDEDPATLTDQLASLGFKPAEAKRFQARLRQQQRFESDAPSDQYPVVAFQGSEAAEFGPPLTVFDADGAAWSAEGFAAITETHRQMARLRRNIDELHGISGRTPGGAA